MVDISVPIHPKMVVYAGDPQPRIDRVASLADGDVANISRLEMLVHSGTHVDAPAHFLPGGAGVDSLPIDTFFGQAHVLDATGVAGDLDGESLGKLDLPVTERLLLRTRNSELWGFDRFADDYCGVTANAAEILVRRGVRLVGIDYLSVAPRNDPTPTHRILLDAGVVIVEGLDLRGVMEGPYELCCLPMLIDGCDGAPARAILVDHGRTR